LRQLYFCSSGCRTVVCAEKNGHYETEKAW
jgi:hypothetical protein